VRACHDVDDGAGERLKRLFTAHRPNSSRLIHQASPVRFRRCRYGAARCGMTAR
jgi:hypothetical protein